METAQHSTAEGLAISDAALATDLSAGCHVTEEVPALSWTQQCVKGMIVKGGASWQAPRQLHEAYDALGAAAVIVSLQWLDYAVKQNR